MTPGPWHIDRETSGDLFQCDTHRIWINADGMHIAYVDGPRTPEREANARLIAAAPALLEALEDLLGQFMQRGVFVDPQHPDRLAVERAVAAIADAKGEKND